MSITGPELDLLQEVLAEDPAADIFMDVAQALFDQGEPRRAAGVLRRALEAGAESDEAAELLARTASAAGDDAGVRVAAGRLGPQAMTADPALARAWALALDRDGDLDHAANVAKNLIEAHGHDPELAAIVERQQAAPPDMSARGRDPYFTASRAEAYFESGRPDLALRVYRRILAAHPENQAVHARLLRMRAMPREARPWVDDLSEEYWLNRPAPPLDMPMPALVPEITVPPDEETTIPGAPMRVDSGQVAGRLGAGAQRAPTPVLPGMNASRRVLLDDFDDEEATVVAPWVGTTDSPDDEPTIRPNPGLGGYSSSGDHELTDLSDFDEDVDAVAPSLIDDDEDATEVRTLSEIRAFSEVQAQSRARSGGPAPRLGGTPRPPPAVSGAFTRDFDDEEATEISRLDDEEDPTDIRRTLPGAAELRRALEEAEFEEGDPSIDEADDADADAIIEQARAIERAAARRRTLFRK